jgi:hypothetical protein
MKMQSPRYNNPETLVKKEEHLQAAKLNENLDKKSSSGSSIFLESDDEKKISDYSEDLKLSGKLDEDDKNALRQKKYRNIPNELRMKLIDAVDKKGERIKHAARKLAINYSSAKSIFQVYKKEGRSSKKSAAKKALKEMMGKNPSECQSYPDQLEQKMFNGLTAKQENIEKWNSSNNDMIHTLKEKLSELKQRIPEMKGNFDLQAPPSKKLHVEQSTIILQKLDTTTTTQDTNIPEKQMQQLDKIIAENNTLINELNMAAANDTQNVASSNVDSTTTTTTTITNSNQSNGINHVNKHQQQQQNTTTINHGGNVKNMNSNLNQQQQLQQQQPPQQQQQHQQPNSIFMQQQQQQQLPLSQQQQLSQQYQLFPAPTTFILPQQIAPMNYNPTPTYIYANGMIQQLDTGMNGNNNNNGSNIFQTMQPMTQFMNSNGQPQQQQQQQHQSNFSFIPNANGGGMQQQQQPQQQQMQQQQQPQHNNFGMQRNNYGQLLFQNTQNNNNNNPTNNNNNNNNSNPIQNRFIQFNNNNNNQMTQNLPIITFQQPQQYHQQMQTINNLQQQNSGNSGSVNPGDLLNKQQQQQQQNSNNGMQIQQLQMPFQNQQQQQFAKMLPNGFSQNFPNGLNNNNNNNAQLNFPNNSYINGLQGMNGFGNAPMMPMVYYMVQPAASQMNQNGFQGMVPGMNSAFLQNIPQQFMFSPSTGSSNVSTSVSMSTTTTEDRTTSRGQVMIQSLSANNNKGGLNGLESKLSQQQQEPSMKKHSEFKKSEEAIQQQQKAAT